MADLGAIGVGAGDSRIGTAGAASAGAARAVTARNAGDAAEVSRAPLITNLQPAVGSQLAANTPLQFDVLDMRGLASVVISVLGISGPEVVYDGAAFGQNYFRSSVSAIQNGLRFVVTRTGGWQVPPQLTVAATNVDGAQA